MGSKNKKAKYSKKRRNQEYEDILFDSDDTFAFIAGYTAGGFLYGITWEEMEEINWGENKLSEKKDSFRRDEEFDFPFD